MLFLLLPFVNLYTTGVTDIDYMVPSYAFLALTAEMIYCIRAPYLTIVQAVGRYKETKHGAYVEAGMNIRNMYNFMGADRRSDRNYMC